MNEDISKNTLLVLVVLTIIVSLLGTWTVIHEATNVPVQNVPVQTEDAATGKVSVDIVAPPKPVAATGKVIFTILDD